MACAPARFPYIATYLFAATGLCALMGSGENTSRVAGCALLFSVGGILVRSYRVGFVLGGIAALILLGEHAPEAVGDLVRTGSIPAPVQISLSVLPLASAIAAVIRLGPLLGTPGG